MKPADVLQQIEPYYFFDYSRFSGALRHYVAISLEEEFRRAPTDLHRRLYSLGLVKEEYMGYEDLGAFLLAFLKWRAGETVLPLKVLLEYGPGEATIDRFLDERHIQTAEQLFSGLRLEDWIRPEWAALFPKINLEKVLRIACEFFVTDCRTNQKRHGIKAYNKIKHGALVVPDASIYDGSLPSTPAALFENPARAHPSPYMLFAIPMTNDHLENRQRSIEFVQDNLRLLSGLYVAYQYPDFLKARGFDPPISSLKDGNFENVMQFLEQVSVRSA